MLKAVVVRRVEKNSYPISYGVYVVELVYMPHGEWMGTRYVNVYFPFSTVCSAEDKAAQLSEQYGLHVIHTNKNIVNLTPADLGHRPVSEVEGHVNKLDRKLRLSQWDDGIGI